MTKNFKKPTNRALFIDSNVWINLVLNIQGVVKEMEYLDSTARKIVINQVVQIELNHNILAKSFPFLEKKLLNVQVIDLSKEVGAYALSLVKGYPNKLKCADALIAATARIYGLELYTNNIKDFGEISGLKLYKPAFHKLPF